MQAENRKKPGRKLKYPWDEMAVGDEFTVPGRNSSSFSGVIAYANNSRRPKRWTARTVGEDMVARRIR